MHRGPGRAGAPIHAGGAAGHNVNGCRLKMEDTDDSVGA